MLTPEKSIELQNTIGADIIMVRRAWVARGSLAGGRRQPVAGCPGTGASEGGRTRHSNWTTSSAASYLARVLKRPCTVRSAGSIAGTVGVHGLRAAASRRRLTRSTGGGTS